MRWRRCTVWWHRWHWRRALNASVGAAGAWRASRARWRALTLALAAAYSHRPDPDLAGVVAAVAAAEACEPSRVAHDDLIDLLDDWPFPRLVLNPPQLALAAVMPLRHGLLRELIRRDDPRRAVQLRAVRDLEFDLLKMAKALDRGEIDPRAALQGCIVRFAQLGTVIAPRDLKHCLGYQAAAVSGMPSTTILTGPAHAR